MKFWILLLFSFSLHAGIEQYFKKAPGKADYHKTRNIDFIYMINLDQRPEKFKSCVEPLRMYGIYPYRFSAVNGWELSLELINDVGVPFQPSMAQDKWWGTYYPLPNFEAQHEIPYLEGRTYFCHCMSRGAIGIVLSHLSILQDAYDSGYQTIWVMEDDVEVIRHPSLISDMIEALDKTVGKKEWDILFTDQDTKNQKGEYVSATSCAWRPNFKPKSKSIFEKKKDVGKYFRKVGARFGAYSMIVRRSGMKKILDFIKKYKIFLPYDMDYYQVPGIQIYTVRKDIVSTQIRAPSDNGGPNYR